jgi:membrane protein implicated in regulation of membrane protease activity
LASLGNPWVLGVAGGMFLIEFVADKVPWVDSIWDVVHTFVRPAGAVLLAIAALGDMSPPVLTVAALLAGGASLATHGTKAGVRAFLNLSPEPVSNSVASVTEDGLVLGGLGLIGLFPTVAFVVFLIVVILCSAIAIYLWKKIFRRRKNRRDELAAAV